MDRDDTDRQVWGPERSICKFRDRDDTATQVYSKWDFSLIVMIKDQFCTRLSRLLRCSSFQSRHPVATSSQSARAQAHPRGFWISLRPTPDDGAQDFSMCNCATRVADLPVSGLVENTASERFAHSVSILVISFENYSICMLAYPFEQK